MFQKIKNLYSSCFNFPSQATENWSSPSLRSGEALNLSTLRSDKLRSDFDPVSVTPLNFPANSFGRSPENYFSSTLRSDEKMNYHSIRPGESTPVLAKNVELPSQAIEKWFSLDVINNSFFNMVSFFIKTYYKIYIFRFFVDALCYSLNFVSYLLSKHKREPFYTNNWHSISFLYLDKNIAFPLFLHSVPKIDFFKKTFYSKEYYFTCFPFHFKQINGIPERGEEKCSIFDLKTWIQNSQQNMIISMIKKLPNTDCPLECLYIWKIDRRYSLDKKCCMYVSKIKFPANSFGRSSSLRSSEYPNWKIAYRSKISFLTVQYTHPKLSEPIDITVPPEFFLVNNQIYSPSFVLRCLQYQPETYYFDANYILQIMGLDTNIFELKYGEYIHVEENSYKICSVNPTG
jgi:hypothetical protein